MRQSQRSIRTFVKSSLPIALIVEALTSHPGLVLFAPLLRESGWPGKIRDVFADRELDNHNDNDNDNDNDNGS